MGVLLLVGPPAEVEAAAPSRGLVWSTFLGGGGEDNPAGIAVDDQGSSYVVGNTESPDFPPGGTLESGHAGFVTKLNPTGSETVYSTLIDLGKGALTGVAVDQEGHAYVSGYQAFGDDPRATAFVAKLDPTGSSFEYLAEIQASDEATFGLAVALDPQGNAYLTGYTGFLDSFPTTPGAFDSTFNGGFNDAYVAKFDPAGTLSYATLLGGGESDIGDSIAVGDDGSAVVSGSTESGDFPTTPGAADPTFAGAREAFVTRLNPAGSALVYSTFLGGGGDEPNAAVALDPQGNAYASGTTTSSDFPTTAGVADQTLGGASDGFVTKLAPAGSLVYSTFLGGSGADGGASVSVDGHGVAHVTGSTSSADFPVTPDALDPTYNGAGDAFVTALDASGSAPLYSTFLGGTAGDGGADVALEQGAIYTTGGTSSGDFPVTPGAFDTTHNGGTDVFVTKLTVPPAAEDPCDRPDAINGSGDIHGTPGDDVICGGPGPDHIDGRGGDDVIYARSGQDVVEGGAGDDFVDGGPGRDSLAGGAGDDTLMGGAGDDDVAGESGNDKLDGGNGADSLSGGAGRDDVRGGPGDDQTHGDAGDDTVRGAAGDDLVAGEGGADAVSGGDGADAVRGGTGADRLLGDAGEDDLAGNEGSDVLVGGAGRDTLRGGNGPDTLLSIDGVADVDNGGTGTDRCRADAIDSRISCETS